MNAIILTILAVIIGSCYVPNDSLKKASVYSEKECNKHLYLD